MPFHLRSTQSTRGEQKHGKHVRGIEFQNRLIHRETKGCRPGQPDCGIHQMKTKTKCSLKQHSVTRGAKNTTKEEDYIVPLTVPTVEDSILRLKTTRSSRVGTPWLLPWRPWLPDWIALPSPPFRVLQMKRGQDPG